MPIYDFAPISLYLKVTDSSGQSLINPEHPKTLVKQGVKMEIAGKFFDLKTWEEARDSRKMTPDVLRYYMPMWYGISYEKYSSEQDDWAIKMGDFDGQEETTREIVIHWGDGTTSKLKYSNAIRYKRKASPDVERHYYLDGVEIPTKDKKATSAVFHIIR